MKLRPSHFQHAFYLKSINIAIIYTRQKGTRVRKKKKKRRTRHWNMKKIHISLENLPSKRGKISSSCWWEFGRCCCFFSNSIVVIALLVWSRTRTEEEKKQQKFIYIARKRLRLPSLCFYWCCCALCLFTFSIMLVCIERHLSSEFFFVSVSQNMRKKRIPPSVPSTITLHSTRLTPNFLSYTMNGNTFRFGGMRSENRVGCWYSHSSSSRIDDGGTGHTSGEEIRARGKIEQSQGKKISNEVECADDERKNVWRKNGERSAELIWIQQRLASPPSKRTYIFGRSEWVSGCWRFFWILFFFAFLLLLICPTVHCLA